MSSFATIVLVLLTLLVATALNELLGGEKDRTEERYALIVTLAGSHKLTEYFEWSCRSIGASAQLFDLLVFHENLRALQNVTCAENVHFFNLGYRGVSKALVRAILHSGENGHRNGSRSVHNSATDKDEDSPLVEVVDRVLQHIPAYVHEMKPLYGQIYEQYLSRCANHTNTPLLVVISLLLVDCVSYVHVQNVLASFEFVHTECIESHWLCCFLSHHPSPHPLPLSPYTTFVIPSDTRTGHTPTQTSSSATSHS